jgi:hypothetical protein
MFPTRIVELLRKFPLTVPAKRLDNAFVYDFFCN